MIEILEKGIKDNDIIIFSADPLKISGAEKDKKGKWKTNKSISFQFNNEVFNEPDKVNDLCNSSCFSIVICNKKILSKDVNKRLKEKDFKK